MQMHLVLIAKKALHHARCCSIACVFGELSPLTATLDVQVTMNECNAADATKAYVGAFDDAR